MLFQLSLYRHCSSGNKTLKVFQMVLMDIFIGNFIAACPALRRKNQRLMLLLEELVKLIHFSQS